MTSGLHWEWRGFGAVSNNFAERFAGLEIQFEPQEITDLYLFIPGLEVNAKFRTGAEGDLKFKRLKIKDGNLEQWHERSDEIFNFPLDRVGWDTLSGMLAGVRLTFEPYPSHPPDRATTLTKLEKAGTKTVSVQKRREGRLWQGPNGKVKVEWASISSPQEIISIGLETWDETLDAQGLPDNQAKNDILSGIEELGLNKEPLKEMNYMDAVALWASQGKI